VIVWFGDAPGHDPVCASLSGLGYDVTESSATMKLVVERIVVLAISTDTGVVEALDADPNVSSFDYGACKPAGLKGQATRIAGATGGTHVTGIDATSIVKTIIDLVTTALTEIKNLKLVPSGSTAPFVSSISPSGGYGPLPGDKEHSLSFDVVFKGIEPCGDAPKVFGGSLDAVADGVVIASKRVTITVPACKPSFVYSVKYLIGTQIECGCAPPPVRPGVYATEVNIHNTHDTEVKVMKRMVPLELAGAVLGRAPTASEARAREPMVLPPHGATMEDAQSLGRTLLGATPDSSLPITIGLLEIESPVELAVTAVFTVSSSAGSVGLQVMQVQPRMKKP
jgi:hypothetical protein